MLISFAKISIVLWNDKFLKKPFKYFSDCNKACDGGCTGSGSENCNKCKEGWKEVEGGKGCEGELFKVSKLIFFCF